MKNKTKKKGRRIVALTALLFIAAAGASAQDADGGQKKFALGIGPEWNMNSRNNFGGSAAFGFIYNLPGYWSAGLSFTAGTNFNGLYTLEPTASIRWYGLSPCAYWHKGPFLQADIGAFIFLEDEGTTTMFNGGLHGGLHIPLKEKFYLEPYGRIGYPFAFGVGALAGFKF
jgi:hypothetical protein